MGENRGFSGETHQNSHNLLQIDTKLNTLPEINPQVTEALYKLS